MRGRKSWWADMEQLELDLRASVLVFPIARNVRKVKEIADRLDALNGPDATAYWREVVTAERTKLSGLGLPAPEINQHLRDLFDSVQEVLAWAAINRLESSP